MRHYADYMVNAISSGVELSVVGVDDTQHLVHYRPNSPIPDAPLEGYYIMVDGQEQLIQLDYTRGATRTEQYQLSHDSINALCSYALHCEVEREAFILAPAVAALKKEFGSKLQVMIVSDYRLVEKDRGVLLLHSGITQTSDMNEKRLHGYMADTAYEGYRIDKHTVGAWRFHVLDSEDPLMTIINDACELYLS